MNRMDGPRVLAFLKPLEKLESSVERVVSQIHMVVEGTQALVFLEMFP